LLFVILTDDFQLVAKTGSHPLRSTYCYYATSELNLVLILVTVFQTFAINGHLWSPFTTVVLGWHLLSMGSMN